MKFYLRYFFVIAAFLFFSCKKDKNILGSNIQPANDSLSSFSGTNDIYAYTIKYDSIISYNSQYKFLGNNLDPYFGNTDIGIYLNSNTPQSNIDFGSTAVLVSSEIILTLDNNELCGNPSDSLLFNIFPLDSALDAKLQYYTSNRRLHNSGIILSSSIQHTTTVGGVPVIRIPLDTTYVGKLMRDKNNLADNATFQNAYRGFFIKATRLTMHEGVIFRCDLENGNSGFYIHYKANGLQDTVIKDFAFNFKGDASAKFNSVKFDKSTANVDLQKQLNGDSTAGGNNLFLKGMGFSRVKLRISNLKNYSDSFKISVNRAELILKVDAVNFPTLTATSVYTVPPSLVLLLDSADNKELVPRDMISTSSLVRYDGNYDPDNNRYVFNIARHVQYVLNGKTLNYGFYLVVADNNGVTTALRDQSIRRVILGGTKNFLFKPSFNITYVKFKKD